MIILLYVHMISKVSHSCRLSTCHTSVNMMIVRLSGLMGHTSVNMMIVRLSGLMVIYQCVFQGGPSSLLSIPTRRLRDVSMSIENIHQ